MIMNSTGRAGLLSRHPLSFFSLHKGGNSTGQELYLPFCICQSHYLLFKDNKFVTDLNSYMLICHLIIGLLTEIILFLQTSLNKSIFQSIFWHNTLIRSFKNRLSLHPASTKLNLHLLSELHTQKQKTTLTGLENNCTTLITSEFVSLRTSMTTQPVSPADTSWRQSLTLRRSEKSHLSIKLLQLEISLPTHSNHLQI